MTFRKVCPYCNTVVEKRLVWNEYVVKCECGAECQWDYGFGWTWIKLNVKEKK